MKLKKNATVVNSARAVHAFYILLIAIIICYHFFLNHHSDANRHHPLPSKDCPKAQIYDKQLVKNHIIAPIQKNGGRSCSANICEKLFDEYAFHGYHSMPDVKMVWKPKKDAYLLMICNLSQLSNRVICLLNYILAAGLLNRTLIVPLGPEKNQGYDLSLVFDIHHARQCLGADTIISAEEFMHASNSSELLVDEAKFYSRDGFLNLKEVKYLWYEQVLLKAKEYEREFTSAPPRHWLGMNMKKFVDRFGDSDARLLTLGDLFYLMLFSERDLFVLGGDVPFIRTEACTEPIVVKPHPSLVRTANVLKESLFPNLTPYLAMHWRRGDFSEFCQNRDFKKPCYYSVEKTMECLKPHLTGFDHMLLSTNAKPDEIEQLSGLIRLHNPKMRVVNLNESLQSHEFDQALTFLSTDQIPVALHLLEKLVCARSTRFIGNYLSSFSRDIERFRYAFKTASVEDKYLCVET